MAFLEKRQSWYRVIFNFQGRRFSQAIHTADRRLALALCGGIERTILQLEQGLLVLPEGADVKEFIVSGGQRGTRPAGLAGNLAPKSQGPLTLAGLKEQYLAAQSLAVEPRTLIMLARHFRRLEQRLGKNSPVTELTLTKLQKFVIQRMRDKGQRGGPLAANTVRKEVSTLRSAWNWAHQGGLLKSLFPQSGLKLPKLPELPPFRTWEEIERQIARGGLSAGQIQELWDCLFLDIAQVEELLGFVKKAAQRPWIYPMFCFAAHTGARRSEMMRAQVADLDLEGEGGSVRIQEKKRCRGRRTSRRVPLSAFLKEVLGDWLAIHPGGPHLFARDFRIYGSTKMPLAEIATIGETEVQYNFRQTVSGSKWQVLHGWHVLRHSFCSCCAAKGVDQRLINSWVGHQTEAMVLRYRHVFPSVEQKALQSVFS